MKGTLYFIPLLLLLSCSNTKKDDHLSEYDKAIVRFSNLKVLEQQKELTDSVAFVGIQLLCSEKEYRNKVSLLVREKRLHKVGENYVYVFELMDGALVAHGKLQPYFYNDMLYKLKIDCEVQGETGTLRTSVLFARLNSLLSLKYHYPQYDGALIQKPEASVYIYGWFGEGKIVELNGGVITYTCASVGKQMYDAKWEEEANKTRDIVKDM